MTKTLTPDICVIGAGSGGLSVAAAASAFGVSVVLLEKGEMGGDCLNYGCVPSKALIAAGKHAQTIRESGKFGVTAGRPKVNFQKVHDHVHNVIETIAPMDSQERFEAMGVTVIRKAARFKDKKTVVAGDAEIKARRFVVATGSSPFVPPIPGIDTVPHHTNETIFTRTESAGRLLVIGGGPIGMEMAQAHQRLGCDVTVIEGDRALGKDDPELAAIVLEKAREEGITILEKTKVVKVEQGKNGILVHMETAQGTETVEGDTLLVATGRKANVAGLDLDKAGIKFDRAIDVTDKLRTTNSRVYAIGDVAGGLQFTHVAGYHAGLVIRAMLFRLPAKNKTAHIPWATYTQPELANVGQTEAEARKAYGDKIQILRWPYAENDRAQAEKKTSGLIKIITDKKGKILGVGIVGEAAGEMMNMWALAVSQGLTVKDIAGYVSPYPTMTEIGKRASTSFYAPTTRKPLVRGVVNFLRMFG